MYENVPAGRPEIHVILVALVDIVFVKVNLEQVFPRLRLLEPVNVSVGMPQAPALTGHVIQPFFLLVEVNEPVDHVLFRFHCTIL